MIPYSVPITGVKNVNKKKYISVSEIVTIHKYQVFIYISSQSWHRRVHCERTRCLNLTSVFALFVFLHEWCVHNRLFNANFDRNFK
jgi:hypothetical protein